MSAFPPVPRVEGIAAPLLRDNVDTDAIIPSREIKGVGKTGLAGGLFAGWRYTAPGTRDPDPDFVLNQPRYAHAPVLLAGENFGCGSSREHAVWALHEYGVRAILAPSFAPIFRGNCIRNGIIPVVIDMAVVRAIAAADMVVVVDLLAQRIEAGESHHAFEIDEEAKAMLAEGLDGIDLTLRHHPAIAVFHAADRLARPWIYLRQEP
ncbi:3-isopropylmalate dehydratase small subunit [Sphingomonas hylomeconis]|uniref:3-isopropylmalate dehydratase small subunit n=1 Tax=Sphingomonas hylomeconis TaxID=1395958 RepID=A0ABV7SZV6_9SPHN|nr:3-isopropylmalate dehydratase small subunit [Sphingomonas hylomeconis]